MHAADVIMPAGGELIMTALAVVLTVNLLRSPAAGRWGASGPREYNAYLALLESKSSERPRSSAPSGHGRARG